MTEAQLDEVENIKTWLKTQNWMVVFSATDHVITERVCYLINFISLNKITLLPSE